jgi:hypothetical protein
MTIPHDCPISIIEGIYFRLVTNFIDEFCSDRLPCTESGKNDVYQHKKLVEELFICIRYGYDDEYLLYIVILHKRVLLVIFEIR